MAAISHKQLKQLRRQHNGLQQYQQQSQAHSTPAQQAVPTKKLAGTMVAAGCASPTRTTNTTDYADNELYPKGSTDPKVFTPHHAARGGIPRAVAIQRKKDVYSKMRLSDILAENDIDYSKERPGGLLPEGPSTSSVFHSYLPLEAFDNTTYDERSPEDWLSLGMGADGLFKMVPALALRTDDVEKGKWCKAGVLDWNTQDQKLLVEWLDHKKKVWLPRVHVMFLAENPESHAQRVTSAHTLRKETESILRYHLYIDSMPIDESEPLGESQLERIRDLSINTNALLENEDSLSVGSIVQEISADYSRTLNRVLFDINMHDPSQAALFQGVPMPKLQQPPPAPKTAQVEIPDHPFGSMLKSFQANTYLHSQEEIVIALQKVKEECAHVLTGSLFVLAPVIDQHLPIPLDKFAELQHTCVDQRCMQLKEQWCGDLRNAIRSSLEGTTEADEVFLREKNREAYERSKLKRLMITVRFMMQDTVYSLSTASLAAFCEMVEDGCSYLTTVKSLSSVEVTRHGQEEDEKLKKTPTPLFKVELTCDNEKFYYTTNQEEFKVTTLAIYDKAVQYQANIPELEHQVMDQFFYNSMPTLPAVAATDPLVLGWRGRIAVAIEESVKPLTSYLDTYDPFVDLVCLDVEKYTAEFKDPTNGQPKPSVQEMDKEIQRHLNRKEVVLSQIPESINLGTYLVSCSALRTRLANKCVALAQGVMELIAQIGNDKAEFVCDEYKKLETEVKMPPQDIERLTEKKKRFKTIPDDTLDIVAEIEKMRGYYTVLDKYQYQLPSDDFEVKWRAISWPKKLEETIEKEEELLEKDRDRFLDKTITEQDEYVKDVEQLQRRVAGFYKKTDIKKVAEIASEVKELNKKLEEAKSKASHFNNREILFHGNKKTDYAHVHQIVKDFTPYAELWTTADNWLTWHHSWTNDPFDTLDPNHMETDANNAWKTMTKAVRNFKDKAPLLKMAEGIKNQIEDFRPIMPIVKYLRQPGMKDRHWTELSKELGFEVRPNVTLTSMHDVYNLELQLHQDSIMKVSEVAMKEFQIEDQLNSMRAEWEKLTFLIEAYKDTGSYVMKGSDEIQQMLDEHLISTQALSFSPFKKQFEGEIDKWEASLRLVQEILEEWLTCQRNWLYLEPIFQSEDISRQLPNEWRRFSDVNKTWKDLLEKAHETPFVITYCCTVKTDKDEDVLPAFSKANAELEKVQKGLNDYLENKRSSFPRFYFLSDDELLQILSEAKYPHKVNKQMRKLFENIHLLDMGKEECEMIGLNSNTGEYMPFMEAVLPRKNIENWLGEVESMMRRSIRNEIELALAAAVTMPREAFIFSVTGQVAGVVLQAYWTSDCETHFKENGNLKKYVPVAVDNLLVLVDAVRNPSLTKLQRINLAALITVEVHTKDIVEELADTNISSSDSFEWISQLRAYWEDNDCFVKQVEARFRYGGEYIGGTNMSRLVITPLTDKIFLTLTGAMNMFLGGAPAGPAGTGKTETVKDLAKALAKQCVVFNCQEGMDYKSMGKFFKGLANAGAWACFDEFNRIDVEVLSVVAQQVGKIQEAARLGVADESKLRIMFEGSEIVVDPTNAVFITMNPGYAGRTELPDNLKVLFRPVACMVPNYALIGEIRLFSFGYRDARHLAQKMVGAFRLSSEQLSSQDHYDFGMRAVNTVINAAGINKREQPDEQEDKLLLRALRDSNVPKFLAEDIKLFNGIISDLFPGVELLDADYTDFLEVANKVIAENHLRPTPSFIKKLLQLTEVTILRHGLMTVGPTMSGKTCAMRTLQQTMTRLNEAGNPSYSTVWTYICNPKSVTMGQLYGQFDLATNEWTDGILCELFRAAANDDTPARKWVIFDGPVDALWIESMNTVLDENKKLCLVSGEIIPMSQYMNVWFEVEDLAVASPATVSRAGMVYMEFEACIGIEELVRSWVDKELPPCFDDCKEGLINACNKYIPPAIEFVRKHCREYIATVDPNLVMSTFKLFNCFLGPYRPTRSYEPPQEKLQQVPTIWQPLFFFCLIWGTGGSVDGKSRRGFDKWLRGEMRRDQDLTTQMPDQGLCHDYIFSIEQQRWMLWEDTESAQSLVVTGETNFQEVVVTTSDVIRYSWLVGHLAVGKQHSLCVGPTGTGKTLVIQRKLLSMPEEYIPAFITFSAQTSANQTQDLLFSRFDRRKKKPLIYGAQQGRQMLIFVDDLNMPQREQYGAQPPIELLRQWMDYGGWYDRKAREFYQIIDIAFIAACGPAGGGRQIVTNRFLRHFNFIAFPDIDNENMKKIFLSILNSFLSSFVDEVKLKANEVVDSSIEIYRTICEEILPRPSKPHYTFNLRDIAKVFQGVLSADYKTVKEGPQFIRMWLHECQRVFRDRLVDDIDRAWFDDLLKRQLQKFFKVKWKDVVGAEDRLVFGDFMNPQADVRVYDEISDLTQLAGVMESYLEEYNEQSQKQMPLVMFLDAIEHVSRIVRIIRKPGGHALLLGVGGSGRQSLSKLASFVNDYEVFQVEIVKGYDLKAWREDEKLILQQAAGVGQEAKPTVFIITDTQIILEQFLEDINNLLNSGEVPNLFEQPELDEINHAMKNICTQEGLPVTKTSLYMRFQRFVKQNLHMSICMSPLGEPFRNRLRKFPALVNCCTIDWFAAWPEQALHSVANEFFTQVEGITTKDQSKCIQMCVFMHQSVEKISEKFKSQMKRYVYVTPTSYLELLNTFKSVMAEQRGLINTTKIRMINGLDKLADTEMKVADLQNSLRVSQPKLAEAQTQIEALLQKISVDTKLADETRTAAYADEQAAKGKAEKVGQIRDSAQAILAVALPALDESLKILSTLQKKEIAEVGSYPNPPIGVKLTMKGVCIMFKDPPAMVGEAGKKKEEDYWPKAKARLSNPGQVLHDLLNYKRDEIPDKVVEKVEKELISLGDDFTPDVVEKKGSKAAAAMCSWVRAMVTYHHTAREVAPKKVALAAAEEELSLVTERLDQARQRLKDVEDKLAELNDKKATKEKEQEQLQKDVENTEIKLERAAKLIDGLAGEKKNWQETVQRMEAKEKTLIGDVLCASGQVSYAGPFTASFRQELLDQWNHQLDKLEIEHSPKTSVYHTISDPIAMQQWAINGLPSDQVSMENGIILHKAKRWPLCIDPQQQANKWIRQAYKDTLEILKVGAKDIIRRIETGIRNGRPVLLENVTEDLDTSLDPLLLQQKFMQGGQEMIKIGESPIPWNPDFKFFMTTKDKNPHYIPEVQVKVTLLNFFITADGLEEQLLGCLVAKERADLEAQKASLVQRNADMKRELFQIQSTILKMLSEVTGDILEDESLITYLQVSKQKSIEINVAVAEAEVAEQGIDTAREGYRPVAFHSSVLYFCSTDLSLVDPMYQYSLQWFTALFLNAIEASPTPDSTLSEEEQLTERLSMLKSYFTESFYLNINRSLFEKHKTLFSFILCIKILQGDDLIDEAEWRFLLSGAATDKQTISKPDVPWVSQQTWKDVSFISSELPSFKGFDQGVAANLDSYHNYCMCQAPHREPLPNNWDEDLNRFQKLIVLRCIRPDKMMQGIQDFVAEHLGEQFIKPPPFDLEKSFKDSSSTTPLIFVLSQGADPLADFMKLANSMRMSGKIDPISLGQGQGVKAERLVKDGVENGRWVLLQNCHLATSWMPGLEKLVENFGEGVHPNFRLWLTSMPNKHFPVSILQNGIKMTNEPPKGMMANVSRSLMQWSDEYFAKCSKQDEFKKLVFALSFFHASMQERRKFGPLGWNIPYEFTTGDLNCCVDQIMMFLNKYSVVPYKVIMTLSGDIHYGGRVTDEWDRRYLMTAIKTFVDEGIMKHDYSFSESGLYRSIESTDLSGYLNYISEWPLNTMPELYGLHENADITSARTEAYTTLATILQTQQGGGGGGGGGGKSADDIVSDLAQEILDKIREPFNEAEFSAKYPTDYFEAMNTVLTQEATRFNKLVKVVRKTLQDLQKAVKGLVVMSHELDAVYQALFINNVPALWAAKAYPSLKPLASWVSNLADRLEMVETWYKEGAQKSYWISGFFFPQAFLTGNLQNFARSKKMPIDTVVFTFDFLKTPRAEIQSAPESGCYCFGTFIEGARWDPEEHSIAESHPKSLFEPMPVFWMKCESGKERATEETPGIYRCPVYKTLTRAGTLSTTGHSTNFVVTAEMPTKMPAAHWIKRGVAQFCDLNY